MLGCRYAAREKNLSIVRAGVQHPDASSPTQPNYRSYIELDLGALLLAAGLRPARKEIRSVTKALSFVKPH
jgi:hypothetical protein